MEHKVNAEADFPLNNLIHHIFKMQDIEKKPETE